MFHPISRRTLLRGAGVAVALPALDAMTPGGSTQSVQAAQSLTPEPRRMVAINFELSFHPPNLIPDTPLACSKLAPPKLR